LEPRVRSWTGSFAEWGEAVRSPRGNISEGKAAEEIIPDKLFFKIGEVAEISGTKPHVLRYWESEFKVLKPVKNTSGQRVYRRKDVEQVLEIKRLLYDEQYTIAGAKKKLSARRGSRKAAEPPRGEGAAVPDSERARLISLLDEIEGGLHSILTLLEPPPQGPP
jgi:DNA-binding transcriptional MerR regulator